MRLPSLILLSLLGGVPALGGEAGNLLAKAARARADLELGAALELSQRALKQGDASVDETFALHTLCAEAAAGLGKRELATDQFLRALLLRPDDMLPRGVSPKILAPFTEAKRRLAGRVLGVKPVLQALTPPRWSVVVRVTGDAVGLVQRGVLFVTSEQQGDPFEPHPLTRAGGLSAEWNCALDTCPYFVVLQDADGNALKFLGDPATPLLAVRLTPVSPRVVPSAEHVMRVQDAPARAFFRTPRPYLLGAAILAASAGAVFYARFDSEQKQLLRAQEDRARQRYGASVTLDALRQRDHALMWTGFGVATALGAATIVFW